MSSVVSGLDREPPPRSGSVTLVHGSTFLLCTPTGEIADEPDGLVVADRRVLSRLALHVDDAHVTVLRTAEPREHSLTVVLRVVGNTDPPGLPPVLVSWQLVLGRTGLQARLLARNLAGAPRRFAWRLEVAADFAHVFAVKEGRVEPTAVAAEAAGGVLTLRGADSGVRLTADWPGAQWGHTAVADLAWLEPGETVDRSLRIESAADLDDVAPAAVLRSGAGAGDAHVRTPEVTWPRLWSRSAALKRSVEQSTRDLELLRVRDDRTSGTVLAAGAPWFMALFGRDSLLTSVMCQGWVGSTDLDVLDALAARQGQRIDAESEEQPGRIPHEARLASDGPLFADGRRIQYGSTDSTALFVIALGEAVRHGADTARCRALLGAADACLDWMTEYGDVDGDGLVESRPMNAAGLINQGWKDSWNAIVSADGSLVAPPYALIEVQAYSIAAQEARAYVAEFLEGRDPTPWRRRAEELRREVDARFWLDDMGTYALALDAGKRPVRTSTTNAGHMLWTGAALPSRAPRLARTLMDRRVRTQFGLRTLEEGHPAYDPLGYHVGSVWPHDTALIAWGMARWGMTRAARTLADSLIRTADQLGGRLPELLAGTDIGDRVAGGAPLAFPTACSPQAWAAAAPLLMVRTVLGLEPDVPRGVVRISPDVPDGWLPLTVQGLRWGDRAVTAAARAGAVTAVGAGLREIREPLFATEPPSRP